METMTLQNAKKMLQFYLKLYSKREPYYDKDRDILTHAMKLSTPLEMAEYLEAHKEYSQASFILLKGLKDSIYQKNHTIATESLAVKKTVNGVTGYYVKLYTVNKQGEIINITQESSFALGYDYVNLAGQGRYLEQWVLFYNNYYNSDVIVQELSELLFDNKNLLHARIM